MDLYADLGIASVGDRFENKDPWVPQHPHRTLILGKSGTGKTVALGNMILGRPRGGPKGRHGITPRYPTPYQEVHLFLGQITEDRLYERMSELLGDAFQIHTLDELEPWIEERKEELAAVKDEGGTMHDLTQCLVALDDFIGTPIGALVESFGTYCRKLNCSVAYLSQDWTKTPISMRLQCNYIIITHSLPAGQLNEVARGLSSMSDVTADDFKFLYKQATARRSHAQFFFIDSSNPDPRKVFRQDFNRMMSISHAETRGE